MARGLAAQRAAFENADSSDGDSDASELCCATAGAADADADAAAEALGAGGVVVDNTAALAAEDALRAQEVAAGKAARRLYIFDPGSQRHHKLFESQDFGVLRSGVGGGPRVSLWAFNACSTVGAVGSCSTIGTCITFGAVGSCNTVGAVGLVCRVWCSQVSWSSRMSRSLAGCSPRSAFCSARTNRKGCFHSSVG